MSIAHLKNCTRLIAGHHLYLNEDSNFESFVDDMNQLGYRVTFIHDEEVIGKNTEYIASGLSFKLIRNTTEHERHFVVKRNGKLIFNPDLENSDQELLTEDFYILLEKND